MATRQTVEDIWRDPNKRNWLYIAMASILVIAVIGYKAHTSWVPATAEFIAEEIPREIYQAIGDSTLESLDGEQFKPSELSETEQTKIRQQFTQIIDELALEQDRYSLHFRDFSEGMNAFALMNGAIVLTDDLVNNLSEPKQLNAVILHEIGHIKHNHLMENTIRVSIFYIAMSFIFGDISIVSDLLIEASAMGLNFSFSREYELEADAYAARSMLTLYGTIEPAVKAFEALEAAHQAKHEEKGAKDEADTSSTINQWLSTHPPTAERIEYIRQIANQ